MNSADYPPMSDSVQSLDSLDCLVEQLAGYYLGRWGQDRFPVNRESDSRNDGAAGPLLTELSEDKKNLVLAEARNTLEAILQLGYRIQEVSDNRDGTFSQELTEIESQLEARDGTSIDTLLSLWRNRSPGLWEKNPLLFLRVGKAMLATGEPLLAYDILSEGVDRTGGLEKLEKQTGDNRDLVISLLQQQALALAQSGASSQANKILCSLHDLGLSDGETLGMLGRTWKDMAMDSSGTGDKLSFLRKSFSCYHKAFVENHRARNLDAAYYTGINAAAVSLLAGDVRQSRQIAGEVYDICAGILEYGKKTDAPVSFWLYASLGEASLLRGDMESAEKWYDMAVQGCPGDSRAMGTMRKQARLILEASGLKSDKLDHCFPVPAVVLFSGHIIDLPTRKQKRFPGENEELVRGRIADWLERNNGQVGFSSAACGSDIIFLEEMLRRGGEIHVVLPFEKEQFVRTSVDLDPESDWKQRFHAVLDKAVEVRILSRYHDTTLDDDLLFTNLYLYGTAQVRAERGGTDLRTLLVWDGKMVRSIAGTAALASFILARGGKFDTVAPQKRTVATIAPSVDASTTLPEPGKGTPQVVGRGRAWHHPFLPLLIADLKGYSRLNKSEKLIFASNFMGEMADVLKKFDDGIMGRKTQGDSLFLVFRDLLTCVEAAKALQEKTESIDWRTVGLSSRIAMRISLDAGPCYSYIDPVTAQLDFCGDYIVRAARLEPVTPPGNIYASETFVAVARAFGIENVKFNYAGQVDLPKGYGRMQAFHVT